MSAISKPLRRLFHVLATPPAPLPDPYEAFTSTHSADPQEWVPADRFEYTGYVHAFEFLAAADARRKTGGVR